MAMPKYYPCDLVVIINAVITGPVPQPEPVKVSRPNQTVNGLHFGPGWLKGGK